MQWKNLVLASALALTSISIASTPAFAEEQHHLSQCGHNALIGAGAGALIGALTSHHHQAQSAVVGAAVGGAATWGVCSLMTNHDRDRVNRDYQRSLADNDSVHDSWRDHGDKSVYVDKPTQTDHGCRQVSGHYNDPQHGRQDLPPETFCRDANGQWVPA